jgi:hypothetical protein
LLVLVTTVNKAVVPESSRGRSIVEVLIQAIRFVAGCTVGAFHTRHPKPSTTCIDKESHPSSALASTIVANPKTHVVILVQRSSLYVRARSIFSRVLQLVDFCTVILRRNNISVVRLGCVHVL